MAEEKIKLEIVEKEPSMTQATRINTLEADVKIEAKYKNEPEYTIVSDTTAKKGEVKSEEGEWEKVPAGKELEYRRVTITPKNTAWYKSRTDVKVMKAGPGEGMGRPGEKFDLEPIKTRTLKVRKEILASAIDAKKAKFTAEPK